VGSLPEKKFQRKSAKLSLTFTSKDKRFNWVSADLLIHKIPERFVLSATELHTDDAGKSDTFTVTLSHKPSALVRLVVSRNELQWATVKPRKLYFTPDTWDLPQTVTVSGVIGEIESPQFTELSLLSDSDDSRYQQYREGKALRITHEMTSGLALSALVGSLANDQEAAFSIALKKAPSQTLTLSIEGGTDHLGLEPRELAFTEDNWSRPQTVLIRRHDPALALPQTTLTFTPSLHQEFTSVQVTLAALPARSPAAVPFATLNFGQGFYRSEENDADEQQSTDQGLSLAAREQAYLDLSLAQAPLAEVAVRLRVPSLHADHFSLVNESGTLLPRFAEQVLRFSPENWDEPQRLTVTFLPITENSAYPLPPAYVELTLSSADSYFNQVNALSPLLSLADPQKRELRGCFIATAAFRDPRSPELTSLRWFRDHLLLKLWGGRRLVAVYYAVGPDLARWVAPHPLARFFVRGLLYPLIWGIEFPWLLVLVGVISLMTRSLRRAQ
jgi:hypothetical protein